MKISKYLVMLVAMVAWMIMYEGQTAQASTLYINDSESSVVYGGEWEVIRTSDTPELYQAYQDDAHISSSPGAYAQFTFNGNTISLISMIGSDLGKADIYIDGIKDRTVDLYIDVPNGGRFFNRAVYNKAGLADGPHTIRIVATGEKNADSSGTTIVVDAFQARTTNLAKDTVVASTTSSLETSGYTAANLVDGDPETIWSSNSHTDSDHQESVMIDLQKTNYIDRIDLHPAAGGEGFPRAWTIEVSKDLEVWTTVGESVIGGANGNQTQSLRIAAQTVRYIRVTGTSLQQDSVDNSYRMMLGEISAYYDDYKHIGTIAAQPDAAYYISSVTGDDSGDGLTPETAWKTLTRASDMIYGPGNRILLKKGDVWTDETFYPHGNGTKDNPILISAYGEGEGRPLIQAGHGQAYGIKIVDAGGYKITGLEFSNSVNGIMVLSDRTAGHEHLWIEDNKFHDLTAVSIEPDLIMPFPEWYYGSGIAVVGFLDPDTRYQTQYNDITIKNNTFERTDTGITMFIRDKPMNLDGGPSNAWYFNRAAMTNVRISDVTIKQSYRSGGIMLYGITDGVVDNAFVDETGYLHGMFWGVAATQVAYSENVIVKNSEFTRTYRENSSPDGEGFDFESGNKNVTLFNTFIHDNVGPSMLFYGQNGGWKGDNENNIIEGNTLYDNGTIGTNDHSQVFKNYPNNTGVIKNNKIKLRFEGQCVCYSPLEFSATNYVYDVSGAQIAGPGITAVDEDDIAAAYAGSWQPQEDHRYFGKKSMMSDTTGSAVELRFWGQTINLIGATGPEFGTAELFIDGQSEGIIDFTSSTEAFNQVVFARTGLTSELHTIKLVATGDGRIVVDAFDYYDGDKRPQKPKENVARKAAVTASSDVGGWGWQAEFLNDGFRSAVQDDQRKGWSSNNQLSTDHEEWIRFDLGSVKRFNEIDLYANDIEMGNYFPIDLIIEVSDDKLNWRQIADREGIVRPTENLYRIVLEESAQARYVKITGTRLMSNPNETNFYRMQLAEVEIYDNGLTLDGGNWTESGGIYIQSSLTGDQSAVYDKMIYDDVEFSVNVKLNQAGDGNNWAGINIRKSGLLAPGWQDGYLVFLSSSGELSLLKADNTIIIAGPAATGLDPTSSPVKLRIAANGENIKVYAGDASTPVINVMDGTYAQGYIGLATHNTSASFSDLLINNAPLATGSDDSTDPITIHLSSGDTVITPGDEIQLSLLGIDEDGAEVDLSGASIDYLSDRLDLLAFDEQGRVRLAVQETDSSTVQVWAKVTLDEQIVLSDPITLVLAASDAKPLGINRALHANVETTSAMSDPRWNPSFLTDGSKSAAADPDHRGWSSASGLTNQHEETVIIDLGARQTFNEIDLYAIDEEMGNFFPVDFAIALSDDRTNWTEVVSEIDYARPTEGRQRFVMDRTHEARYVKVTGTKLLSDPDESGHYLMQLAEIEVLDHTYVFRDSGWDLTAGGMKHHADQGIHFADYDAATFADTDLTAVVKMNSYGNRDNWIGISIRKQNPAMAPWEDGYFIFMRENGDVTLMKGGAVILADSVKTGKNPVNQAVKLRFVAQGSKIQVFVNDEEEPIIELTDDTFMQGYVGFATNNASADFLAIGVNGELLHAAPNSALEPGSNPGNGGDPGSTSGGGIGENGSQTPANGTKTVPPEEIVRLSQQSTESEVVIAADDGAYRMKLPLNTSELLGGKSGKSIAARFGQITVVIPNEMLAEAAGLGSGNDDHIVLTVQPFVQSRSALAAARKQWNAKVGLFAPLYQLELAVEHENVTVTGSNAFENRAQIRWTYNPDDLDEQLLGLYSWSEAEGNWQYIGGRINSRNHTLTADLAHFSTYAVMELDKSFDDVPVSHWAHRSIQVMASKHVANGKSDKRFEPNAATTRAEFIQLLANALDLKARSEENPFEDVSRQSWYHDAVAAAFQAGIVQGVDASTFAPDQLLTREQMAVMLVQAFEYLKENHVRLNTLDTVMNFHDEHEAADWARASIVKAAAAGLLQGREEHRFSPKAELTRAESVQALLNLLNLLTQEDV